MFNIDSSAKKRSFLRRKLYLFLFSFRARKVQEEALKRCFDLLFSLSLLVLLLPFFLMTGLLIKINSKGPIIFSQARLGKGDHIFKCYKFRTMYVDAEQRLEEILYRHPLLKKEWELNQKLQNDPRITPIGKFLRKTSLDELPQFWNVIKGDISVVGPRPYMVFQKKDLGNKAKIILSVHPGITGLWQTSGRSQLSFQKRIELDADYVKKRSFLYDLKLIIKTIPALLNNKNAC